MGKLHTSIYDFEWYKSSAGYELIEQAPVETKIPTVLSGFNPGKALRPKGDEDISFRPFEEYLPLVRKFSDLKTSSEYPHEEGVIDFANEFGMLGLYPNRRNSDPLSSEYLSEWNYAASSIALIYEQLSIGALDNAASLYNNTSLKLAVQPRFSAEVSFQRTGLQFRPVNLLTAMWFLLAEEIQGRKKFTRCSNRDCMEWYPARENRKWCSDRCRQVGCRNDKKQKGSHHSS
ncbi:MAG: hypothetical protein LRY36_01830 [Alphaproteobacteria bacterium]|nr:hypothetical protein [Alphaproteobacteria bacterium]